MVISNRQRKAQNVKKMDAKKRRKAALASKPKPTKSKAKKKAKPRTTTDNAVKVSELDLPARAINSLKADGLGTKGAVRRYLRDYGTVEKVRGIGKVWAQLIEKLVKLRRA